MDRAYVSIDCRRTFRRWSKSIYICTYTQACRKWGQGVHASHFLSDQLTLSQPGDTYYPHLVLRAPRIFGPSDGPDTRHMYICA